MADHQAEPAVKPEVLLLGQLLDEVASGQLRVPDFQRSFVWRRDQMIHLYDSIERGYPIGSFLVWHPGFELPSLRHVAGIEIPPPPPDRPVGYLLDGHQRMSTLWGTLTRRPAPTGGDLSERKWWIYRTLGSTGDGGFLHWDQPGPPPATYLPMQAILRTMDFFAFARRLTREIADADALIEEAEGLAQQIKSYKVAVIRLVGGDLSHAVEAFSRLNSAGQQITPDQMVSALTYRQGASFSLAARITAVRERLAESGFGEVPRDVVFRTILAVTGEEDVQDAQWQRLAEKVRDSLDRAVGEAEEALHRTVSFLRYQAGVPLALLVPHPAQIMLLAVFHHLRPEPDAAQVRALVRWFWATSWSGTIASANGARMGRLLQQMRDFAGGIGELSADGHTAQPFPDWFDTDNGRVRAYILWELREFNQRRDVDGGVLDPVDELARVGFAAYRRVVGAKYPWGDSPANRLVLPTPAGVTTEEALLNLPPERIPAVLDSHGIPRAALVHLRSGDAAREEADDESDEAEAAEDAERPDLTGEERFIQARAAALAERERAFMREMGVDPPPAPARLDL
jgi:Protein of unknown function DUF262